MPSVDLISRLLRGDVDHRGTLQQQRVLQSFLGSAGCSVCFGKARKTTGYVQKNLNVTVISGEIDLLHRFLLLNNKHREIHLTNIGWGKKNKRLDKKMAGTLW
jgi:hypothetical protein